MLRREIGQKSPTFRILGTALPQPAPLRLGQGIVVQRVFAFEAGLFQLCFPPAQQRGLGAPAIAPTAEPRRGGYPNLWRSAPKARLQISILI